MKVEFGAFDEVVTANELKNYAKISGNADDTLITDILIPASREAIEKYTGVSLSERTVECTFYEWQSVYSLPYGPVNSITKVERLFSDNTAIELDSDDYYLKDDRILLDAWYSTRVCIGVKITYVAGYETVPPALKLACLKQAAYSYENREFGGIASDVLPLAQQFKRFWL